MARKDKAQADLERELLKSRVTREIIRHVGKQNAIGMGELYTLVYGESWTHRINDTRPLRKIITELRDEGYAIFSTPLKTGGGYFLASVGSELEECCVRGEGTAIRKLARIAKMRKTTLPALLGQLSLNAGE